MHELKRGQIKKIINAAMKLTNEITLRDTIKLEDIYKIAEGVKGEKITKREKLIISGIVIHCYSTHRKLENKKLKVLIMF